MSLGLDFNVGVDLKSGLNPARKGGCIEPRTSPKVDFKSLVRGMSRHKEGFQIDLKFFFVL